MKKFLKSLVVTVLVITTCLGLYAFKKYQQVKTAADVFKNIMYNAIYTTSSYDKKVWADSTLTFKRPTTWDSTVMETVGPDGICGTVPSYFYYNMAMSIGADDVNYSGYSKQNLLEFKQAFGKDLLGANVPLAGRNFDKKPKVMKQFKADALKAAFNKLYKKPTEDFDGFAMQRIYDIAAKDYFRNCAQVVADVMKKKALFVKLSLDYKKQATTKKEFYGPDASYEAMKKILGEDYNPGQGTDGCMEYGADRILGIMMRRQLDGTLPTLLICAKTMLQDYDPEFYNTIKNAF